jgi:hypothetical protein
MEECAWLGGRGSVSIVEMVEAENWGRCRERSVCRVVNVAVVLPPPPVAMSKDRCAAGSWEGDEADGAARV